MRRPWPVTVFGILFVLAGSVGFGYHLAHRPFERDVILISAIRLLAVLGGAFLLLGHNWARWLLLAWLAFHIVVSAFHSVQEVAAHVVLFLLFAYSLFRPSASGYFRSVRPE